MSETMKQAIRSYHVQTSKKFPTITFEIAFLQEQTEDTMAPRTLVARVLPQVLAAFPSKIATKSYFADLYAARIYHDVSRWDDKHEVTFLFMFTDPQFVNDPHYQLSDIFNCIQQTLLAPHLVDGSFMRDVVALENTLQQAHIINMADHKIAFAHTELLKHMFAGTPFALRAYGDLSAYPPLTAQKVFATYQQMLAEDTISISVVGNVTKKQIEQAFSQMFTTMQTRSKPLTKAAKLPPARQEVQTITITQPVNQARLHIGYRIPATVHAADYFHHKIATEILGGDSQSKLFQNVRERASLAYSIAATISDFAEAVFIYAGVDRHKIAQAQTIIREQVQAIQAGDITEEALQLAKENLLHRISMAQDSPIALLRLQRKLEEFKTISTIAAWREAILAVQIKDVVAAVQSWHEDTVLILTDKA